MKEMEGKKVIARIKGGLGNQLFCYAAARRLALVEDAELVVDDVSGFIRDREYRRSYMLDYFNITARKATPMERMEPFERYRREIMRRLWRLRPFEDRRYLEQEKDGFDERLLALKVKGAIYLDGLWQSENYFRDVAQQIREDFKMVQPADAQSQDQSRAICGGESVAVHVRWFDPPGGIVRHNLPSDYYRRAVELTELRLRAPHYFIFSDNAAATRTLLDFPVGRTTHVSHDSTIYEPHADLWLMTLCRHFIIANSTFSWWGAWLGSGESKLVICPGSQIGNGQVTSWNLLGQIPDNWLKL